MMSVCKSPHLIFPYCQCSILNPAFQSAKCNFHSNKRKTKKQFTNWIDVKIRYT